MIIDVNYFIAYFCKFYIKKKKIIAYDTLRVEISGYVPPCNS